MTIWSPQQDAALQAVARWARSSEQVFYLAGYAGTGKTTLARYLADTMGGRWLFAAFTGKAAHVLTSKECPARTIHSLIYRPNGESKTAELRLLAIRTEHLLAQIAARGQDGPTQEQKDALSLLRRMRAELEENRRPQFALWADSPLSYPEYRGVIVDEVSMVDERLGRDLESFGKKILVLGDPAQLPPVGAGGYFTSREPNHLLTQVHRQSLESGILRLATRVRENGDVRTWSGTPDCEVWLRPTDPQLVGAEALATDQILVGRNATRRVICSRIRELLGRTDQCPVVGDRMVCLRNDRVAGIFNGSQWSVTGVFDCDVGSMTASLVMESEDDASREIEVCAWLHHVLDRSDELAMLDERRDLTELDWGYALTVHKSQGSQWGSVLVFDESASFGQDRRRHLYTAITRASERLVVIA